MKPDPDPNPLSNDFKGKTGIVRLLNAMRYSWQGLMSAWRHEAAFREEILLAFIALPLGFWLGNTGVERALLMGSIILILIVELINSTVEAVVDRISLERHELSKRAKDMGSAAVLLSLLAAVTVWLCILWP